MSYIKTNHPHHPKSNNGWSDNFLVPVLNRSAEMAQKLKLPAVTREISLFVMMQECPAIIDNLEKAGVQGKKLYHALVNAYALYARNGFNNNHVPEDMEKSIPYVSDDLEANQDKKEDANDYVSKLMKESQAMHSASSEEDKPPSGSWVDTDIDVGSIMLVASNDIEVMYENAPNSVTQETYNDYAYGCFLKAAENATAYPVGYYSVYGPTPLLARYLYEPDEDDEACCELLPQLLDELYPAPEGVEGAYNDNKKDMSSDGKKKKKENKKNSKNKNKDDTKLDGQGPADGLSDSAPSPS